MFHNYWVTALRSFRKNLFNTLVLTFGLTAGITSFIFISIFVIHEKSFDRFHEKADRIFRVQQNHYSKNILTNASASSNFGIGQDLAAEFPEIETYTVLVRNKSTVRYNNEVFREDRAAFATADFFNVFSFNLIRGNDSLVLARPYTIALSESMAHKIFKDEDPIGKTLNVKGRYDFEVTGVFEDMPENSHMNLHVIMPFETFKKFANPSVIEYPWRWDDAITYILLRDGRQGKDVEAKIPALTEKKSGDWYRQTEQRIEISLQPLPDIHLHSNFSDELQPNGNYQVVNLLAIIAASILGIAWLNYISMAVVKALNRAKEVGVRKVLGGSQLQLITQFLAEAFLINFLSLMIALLVVYFAFPAFSHLLERNFQTDFFTAPLFWGFIVALLVVSTLITGFYPAFIMSATKTPEILNGKFTVVRSGKLLRKLTVFIPFTVTIILLTGLFIVYWQLEFLKSQQLGFDPLHKLVVRDSEIYDSLYAGRVEVFKKEVQKISGIEGMSYISQIPGEFITGYNDVIRLGADQNEVTELRFITVDENFIDALGLTLLLGGNFTSTSVPRKEIIINEAAWKVLGFKSIEDAIGQRVCYNSDTARIRGVIRDYYHETPKQKIRPTYYRFYQAGGYYFVLPVIGSHPEVLNNVQNLFTTIFPGQPFEYFFLTDKYGSQYNADEKFEKVISVFFVVLLVLTASGLLSLSSYTARLRTKEIAVRKALGASEQAVTLLMLKEYIVLILAAAVVAGPIAFAATAKWLNSFTLKTTIYWWMFALPVVLITGIAVLTIITQILKIARINPAKTLKNE